MVSFSLNESQLAIQDAVRKFVSNKVKGASVALDLHAEADQCVSQQIISEAMAMGLGGALIPEQYGGYGGNLMDYSIIIEELAYGDAGMADIFLVNISMALLIYKFGSDAQKETWLTKICGAENGGMILAGAMTEPSGGSEIFSPLAGKNNGVRTTATKTDQGYKLKGRKCFITNAGIADLYIVLARTDPTSSNLSGCSIFLVPADSDGISFGSCEDKMGHRLSSVREILFEEVEVPMENRIGVEGAGFQVLMECYEGNGIGIGSSAIGLARAAYDAALEYAKERVVWNEPIIQKESVAAKLVDMRMSIEASRALVWKVAWAAQNGEEQQELKNLSAMAKVQPSAMVRDVAIKAMEVFGGIGYMRGSVAEKYARDAMLYPIYDGTNDLLKRFIAQQLSATNQL